jgi:hypothetical protein
MVKEGRWQKVDLAKRLKGGVDKIRMAAFLRVIVDLGPRESCS